jgi:hypothetical protein
MLILVTATISPRQALLQDTALKETPAGWTSKSPLKAPKQVQTLDGLTLRLYSINRERNGFGYPIGLEISASCGRLIAILGAILLPNGRTLPTQAVAPCRPL